MQNGHCCIVDGQRVVSSDILTAFIDTIPMTLAMMFISHLKTQTTWILDLVPSWKCNGFVWFTSYLVYSCHTWKLSLSLWIWRMESQSYIVANFGYLARVSFWCHGLNHAYVHSIMCTYKNSIHQQDLKQKILNQLNLKLKRSALTFRYASRTNHRVT